MNNVSLDFERSDPKINKLSTCEPLARRSQTCILEYIRDRSFDSTYHLPCPPDSSQIDENVCVKKNLHLLSSPKMYLVRSSFASSGVRRVCSINFFILGEMFISAIFLAKNSSSALRLVSSASRMDSCKNSMTAYITSGSAPFVASKMGAKGDAWIFLTVAVITSFFLISCGKSTTNKRNKQIINKNYAFEIFRKPQKTFAVFWGSFLRLLFPTSAGSCSDNNF